MFDYLDADNVGIWGWSYGGYNTASVLAKDTKNVFKCGISVAPVTNWMLHSKLIILTILLQKLIPDQNVKGKHFVNLLHDYFCKRILLLSFFRVYNIS